MRRGKPSTDLATIQKISHVHVDRSNTTKTKIRRPMESKMDWWNAATCCCLEPNGGVFKVHCITTLPAIQSSDPECLVNFSSVGMFGSSAEFIRLVHQEFLLQFDRVHLKDLVTGLDPIHLPTAARIGFGNHSVLRCHLPMKKLGTCV